MKRTPVLLLIAALALLAVAAVARGPQFVVTQLIGPPVIEGHVCGEAELVKTQGDAVVIRWECEVAGE